MKALAISLAIFSIQHIGIPELIKDGESGFLVPEHDIDALAERIRCLLEPPQDWPKICGRKL